MRGLSKKERDELLERYGREVTSGTKLYEEGARADTCYIIQEGRVRLVKRIRSAERSLTVLRPGDLFGEDALLSGVRRSSSAVALTDSVVLALDSDTFTRLLIGNSEVAQSLIKQLVSRLRDAEEQLENAMLRDHPSRIVNTLLRLSQSSEDSVKGNTRTLIVSPLELSSRAGLDVEDVKRAVQQLRDGGYLQISDESIVLPDLAALTRLYELLGMKEEVRGG